MPINCLFIAKVKLTLLFRIMIVLTHAHVLFVHHTGENHLLQLIQVVFSPYQLFWLTLIVLFPLHNSQ